MKVYIEDYASGEIMINDTPCRKIGVLKNGEEKTFEISENASKVFVIAGKMSKNFCNDFYNIPAGEEDIYLSGQNRYNLASGNAFRFDGVADEEVLQNRKKGTKIGVVVLIAAIIVGGILGYLATSGILSSSTKEKPKDFSTNGMTITLTDNFRKTVVPDYTACYESKDVAVFVVKEEFDLFDGFGDYTLEEYGTLIIEGNALDSSVKLQNKNGLTSFEYQAISEEDGKLYNYYVVVYKASDAFWMIQFVTVKSNSQSYQKSIIDWAKSVTFSR